MQVEMFKEKEKEKKRNGFNFESWFDSRFWPSYPRKRGREIAKKKASRIVRTPEIAEKVMVGLAGYIANDWHGIEAKFIPHPATFLNQKRFTDEVEKVAIDEGEIDWETLQKHYLRLGRYTDEKPVISETGWKAFCHLGGRALICDGSSLSLKRNRELFLTQRRMLDAGISKG